MPYEAPFIGLMASLLFITLTGFYPGGVIVPSYLVLFLDQPARLGATLVVALLTLLCFRLASQWLILFGARRFVFMVLVAALWSFAASRALSSAPLLTREFQVIGWIVPGLMSNAFERQGIALTTASIVTVTVASYFVGRLLGITV
jgi:poly-gamma-glutamate biosynthesis protein PgsC/CapC